MTSVIANARKIARFFSTLAKRKVLKKAFVSLPMAIPSLEIDLNQTGSEIANLLWRTMPSEFTSGISLLITLGKVAGIVFIVYLLFLVIKSIINIRQALRMKSIANNVAEINKKLDLIIGKNQSKPKEENKEKKDEKKK